MSERTLRILVVAPRLPYPPTWGLATRGYQLSRLLARRHEVTMVCFANRGAEQEAREFEPELTALHTVPLRPLSGGGSSRRVAQLRALGSPTPFLAATERTPTLQAAIDGLVGTQQFDSIHLESLAMFGLRFPRDIPIVLGEHNIEYELLQRLSVGEHSAARRAYNRIEFEKLRRFEHRAWRTVAGVAITSEREVRIVRSVAPHTPAANVPNGVDTEYFAPAPTPPEPDSLVFTGLLSYRPNIDAVQHLVNDIFPLVRRERPSCTLTIVGGGGDDLAHLAGPGIRFTGYVPDLRPEIARASVAVVPIRMGSGTRLKVVEALAMAKPMVSTTIGCEGIDVHDEEHLLIGDSPAAFATQVLRLLDDPDAAQRMGERGAALARSEYSWSGAADVLEALHLRVTDKQTARP